MADGQEEQTLNAVELATELTIAWLGNANVRANADEVPAFLKSMHATIGELSNGNTAPQDTAPEYAPAVPVRSSVKPDFLVSLIDGSRLKSLKRHLSKHGLTPKDYRERYGLKADYPMVAANYSAQRREVAQRLGLGRKPAVKAAQPAPAAAAAAPAKAATKRTRRPKAAVEAAPAKPASRRKSAAKPTAAKQAPAKRGRKKAGAPAA